MGEARLVAAGVFPPHCSWLRDACLVAPWGGELKRGDLMITCQIVAGPRVMREALVELVAEVGLPLAQGEGNLLIFSGSAQPEHDAAEVARHPGPVLYLAFRPEGPIKALGRDNVVILHAPFDREGFREALSRTIRTIPTIQTDPPQSDQSP